MFLTSPMILTLFMILTLPFILKILNNRSINYESFKADDVTDISGPWRNSCDVQNASKVRHGLYWWLETTCKNNNGNDIPNEKNITKCANSRYNLRTDNGHLVCENGED